MASICIVTPPPYLSETFIRLHEQRLSGVAGVLRGKFPDYTSDGKLIRYRCVNYKRWRRFWKLLPHVIYERYKATVEPEAEIAMLFISQFLRESGADVILAEYGMTGADITPIAKALNIPLVVHFHGHDAYHYQYLNDYRERLAGMFEYASAIISVSSDMTGQLERIGAPSERIVLNPYGPREIFFTASPTYDPVFLALGRFVETKAPQLTLSAFRLLLNERPNAKLILAGDGPLRGACVDMATALGIAECVEFPGAVPADESLALFERACCFVQHSIQAGDGVCEGTPVAILEAGAAGLPVVATRHAGIKDAVIEGTTGYLVEEKDVHGMAKRMRDFIDDPDLCRQFGAAARGHIARNYSIERHLNMLQSILEQSASDRRRSGSDAK